MTVLLNQLALELYQMMRARGLGGKDVIEALHFLADGARIDIRGMHPAEGRGDAEE